MINGILSNEELTITRSLITALSPADKEYIQTLSNELLSLGRDIQILTNSINRDKKILGNGAVSANDATLSIESIDNLSDIHSTDIDEYRSLMPSNESIAENPSTTLAISLEEKLGILTKLKEMSSKMFSMLTKKLSGVFKSFDKSLKILGNEVDDLVLAVSKINNTNGTIANMNSIKKELGVFGVFNNGVINSKNIPDFLSTLNTGNMLDEHLSNVSDYVDNLSTIMNINDGVIPREDFTEAIMKLATIFKLDKSINNNFIKKLASGDVLPLLKDNFEHSDVYTEVLKYKHVNYLPYSIANSTIGIIVTMYNDTDSENDFGEIADFGKMLDKIKFRNIKVNLESKSIERLSIEVLSKEEIVKILAIVKNNIADAKLLNDKLTTIVNRYEKLHNDAVSDINKTTNEGTKSNIVNIIMSYNKIYRLGIDNIINGSTFDYLSGIKSVVSYCKKSIK